MMLHDSRDLFLQIVLLASEAMRIDSGNQLFAENCEQWLIG